LVAKHGQDPRLGVGNLLHDNLIPSAIQYYLQDTNAVAQATEDDVALIWLKDQSKIVSVTSYLQSLTELPVCTSAASGSATVAPTCNPGIATVYSGSSAYQAGLAPSAQPDSRTPDVFVQALPGYIFVGNPTNGKKIAEHGAIFNRDASNIALVVGGAGLSSPYLGSNNTTTVKTTQIAVTVLQALGLDPTLLKGAQIEHTTSLPGLNLP